MTFHLWVKLLRDVRVPLLITAILLFAFQALWVKITQQITTELSPMFRAMASFQGISGDLIEKKLFDGPGKVLQTILGGEDTRFDNPQHLLVAGYLYPFVQVIFCIWAIGRSAGAIAGELERGTMELLLSMPLARSKLILAHLLVDLTAIPLLCLALWLGTEFGCWLVGPFVVDPSIWTVLKLPQPEIPKMLIVNTAVLAPALWNVAALLFSISGITLAISAAGRFRNRVLGFAILFFLVQFLVNVIGQFWNQIAFLRPFTLFYYYQPQRIVTLNEWWVKIGSIGSKQPGLFELPMIGILVIAGTLGYLSAWWTLIRRDIPAPL